MIGDAGTYSQPRAGAVHERITAPQQRCVVEARSQRERQWSGEILSRSHPHGMKPIDIADRVVDCRVERDRIRTAIWQQQELLAGLVRDGRTQTAQQVSWKLGSRDYK